MPASVAACVAVQFTWFALAVPGSLFNSANVSSLPLPGGDLGG